MQMPRMMQLPRGQFLEDLQEAATCKSAGAVLDGCIIGGWLCFGFSLHPDTIP
jgi:hypothetical protein